MLTMRIEKEEESILRFNSKEHTDPHVEGVCFLLGILDTVWINGMGRGGGHGRFGRSSTQGGGGYTAIPYSSPP